jgi:hemerythrin
MVWMKWNDGLDIGVKDMNREHQGLLDYMNQLFDLHNAKASRGEQKRLLDKLKNATIDHFTHEEEYMAKIGWEGLPAHKIVHQGLLDNFTKHYQKFLAEGVLSEDFFHFLKFWLSAHIQGIDKKYGDFARETKKAS